MLKSVMRLSQEVPDFEGGLVLKYTSSVVVMIPNVIIFSPTMCGTRQEERLAE